jgi:4-hydroxyproline epimerase
VHVDGLGAVRGDVAWGGNWFFLVEDHGERLDLQNVARLTDVAWRIRHALQRDGIRGDDGGEIDHIELFGSPGSTQADSRNFVLCPGGAYDRSPCGTGTSAKLACLVADGKLQPGQIWRQESIIGSIFEGQAEIDGDWVIPHITGWAYIDSEATLLLHRDDPYRAGISGSREAGP